MLFEKVGWETGAAAEELVELGVAEAEVCGVFNSAAVINFFNIGPKDGRKTHQTRFASGVEFTAR